MAEVFYGLSFIVVGSGIMVVSTFNPVFAVFWLVVVFISSAFLFLLLGIDFIAFIFLIIYVGAITILFLFVIMLLNLTDFPPGFRQGREADVTNYVFVGLLLGVFFFSEILSGWLFHESIFFFLKEPQWELTTQWTIIKLSNVEALGGVLYTICLPLFFLASFVLLVALIGALILTKETVEKGKFKLRKQDLFSQINKKF
uniref:NADH-ubiquinone oxidoreductase chain 6 n=1 Tax=Paraconotrochus antarcticus TaxID=2666516 RepID=A0A7T1W790_9CNID|nr:NADH dehydrogenase subunit 6 [Paraconotrochus antarcticus]QPO84677.1 NADH dehydrogenase subunit 6 [Paraconotrochus antarcticus]